MATILLLTFNFINKFVTYMWFYNFVYLIKFFTRNINTWFIIIVLNSCINIPFNGARQARTGITFISFTISSTLKLSVHSTRPPVLSFPPSHIIQCAKLISLKIL